MRYGCVQMQTRDPQRAVFSPLCMITQHTCQEFSLQFVKYQHPLYGIARFIVVIVVEGKRSLNMNDCMEILKM